MDITRVRSMLEDKIKRLESDLSRFAKPTSEPGNYETQYENIGRDKDDNAHEVENYGGNLAMENSLESQIKVIQRVIQRIDAGNYGICISCGNPIEEQRLEAYPEAEKCSVCASKEEAE